MSRAGKRQLLPTGVWASSCFLARMDLARQLMAKISLGPHHFYLSLFADLLPLLLPFFPPPAMMMVPVKNPTAKKA